MKSLKVTDANDGVKQMKKNLHKNIMNRFGDLEYKE